MDPHDLFLVEDTIFVFHICDHLALEDVGAFSYERVKKNFPISMAEIVW